ncbi:MULTISPECIES: OmpH family outer membrane protein [Arcicella]|uniref:OmpH family outer membrane protein n=1 Tax=Arcicella aquatica TaxID=217141 RepID=A0ABU5QK26_9BACT|nr:MULTISPECIES: OmpH family outer membrane protein [Arcicella]MDR6559966.1 outer membrane protein [Arcicella sp. BE51]MDR6810427.1 outer membrane protein [Arcicella sp. BE140]MDR6821777.1 outer membrane protein [Arcicella sp. BE139]MEA5257407.1 OmpH family outer membrane protein [Arcicella aquatica]
MKNKFLIALFAILALATANVNAQQKIGYISLDYILAQMPEAKQVETELTTTKTQYDNMYQQKVKDFQTKLADYEKNAATMADVIKADREKELQGMQSSIEEFRQNSSTSLQKKQAQLLQPLLKKIEDNMHGVAKENGFAFVFNYDAGQGTTPIVLHAPDDANISDLVLKRMGVTPKPLTPAPATPAATAPKK